MLGGSEGVDTLWGGAGDDTYIMSVDADFIIDVSDEGTDLVVSHIADYALPDGYFVENLTLAQGSGAVTGTGNYLNNVITGNANGNTLHGMGGADTIYGIAGTNSLYGDDGADLIYGGAGGGSANGGLGDDRIYAGTGTSLVYGDEGADTLIGMGGAGSLFGGEGGDRIDGGSGGESIYGGDGNNTLNGGAGDDIIEAGNITIGYFDVSVTRDVVDGGAGNDTLNVGGGDTVYGGSGADRFVIRVPGDFQASGGVITIMDFEVGVDKLDLSAANLKWESGLSFGNNVSFSDGNGGFFPTSSKLYGDFLGTGEPVTAYNSGANLVLREYWGDFEIVLVGVNSYGMTVSDFIL